MFPTVFPYPSSTVLRALVQLHLNRRFISWSSAEWPLVNVDIRSPQRRTHTGGKRTKAKRKEGQMGDNGEEWGEGMGK